MPDQERGGISMPSGASREAEPHGQLVRCHCEKHYGVGRHHEYLEGGVPRPVRLARGVERVRPRPPAGAVGRGRVSRLNDYNNCHAPTGRRLASASGRGRLTGLTHRRISSGPRLLAGPIPRAFGAALGAQGPMTCGARSRAWPSCCEIQQMAIYRHAPHVDYTDRVNYSL
jgi:hypothetical protein